MHLRLVLALLLALGVTQIGVAQNPNVPAAQNEPHEVRVSDSALMASLKAGMLALPQLRVYDRQSLQIADFGTGFDPDTLRTQLEGVMHSPVPKPTAKSLQDEVKDLVEKDGKPPEKFAESDFTIVEYWAEWCLPCEKQAKLLAEVVSAHPELSINVLHVEADPAKLKGVTMKRMEVPVPH